MDARTKMLTLIRNRRAGFSLEQPFCIDPGFFRLDMELILYRDGLFAGHDCEIDEPGSPCHPYDLDGSPVFARDMRDDFRKEAFRMKPAACESDAGHIFFCLAGES